MGKQGVQEKKKKHRANIQPKRKQGNTEQTKVQKAKSSIEKTKV